MRVGGGAPAGSHFGDALVSEKTAGLDKLKLAYDVFCTSAEMAKMSVDISDARAVPIGSAEGATSQDGKPVDLGFLRLLMQQAKPIIELLDAAYGWLDCDGDGRREHVNMLEARARLEQALSGE